MSSDVYVILFLEFLYDFSCFSSVRDIRQLVREADNLQRLGTISLKGKVHTNIKKMQSLLSCFYGCI